VADVVCAHSGQLETIAALAELKAQLSDIEPVAIMFFCSANHDGARLQRELKALAPNAEVVGCTTGGEFTHRAYTQNGVSLLALSSAKVRRCAAAMAEYDAQDVEVSVHAATRRIADRLQIDLRELDPERWMGIVLNEGMKGNEEEVNAVLGHIAPFLSFIGGSAGDNYKLQETEVFYDGRSSKNGSVFLLMELAVPHYIIKTCSFAPTPTRVRINKVQGRVVYVIDGKPALARYAEIVGLKPEELNMMVFASNPLGVMIEGQPWVRSPIMATPDGGLLFGCRVLEGSELNLLHNTGQLVADTKRALAEGVTALGREPSAGLLFNCAHRCMEIQAKQLEAPFSDAIGAFPVAGFHSYGESWLAHMNQTLIGLLIG
jgi:hypothetical protein